MRPRTRSVVWLLVPALLGLGVVGAKRWSRHDPLVAGVGTPVSRTASDTATGFRGEAVMLGPLCADTSTSTGSAVAHAHTEVGKDCWDVHPASVLLPHSEESGTGLQLLTAGRCPEIVRETGRTEPGTASGMAQLGAERHIVLLGAGPVSSDVVGLVEQLGSGPWEVDLRYRGLIVIRKETP